MHCCGRETVGLNDVLNCFPVLVWNTMEMRFRASNFHNFLWEGPPDPPTRARAFGASQRSATPTACVVRHGGIFSGKHHLAPLRKSLPYASLIFKVLKKLRFILRGGLLRSFDCIVWLPAAMSLPFSTEKMILTLYSQSWAVFCNELKSYSYLGKKIKSYSYLGKKLKSYSYLKEKLRV